MTGIIIDDEPACHESLKIMLSQYHPNIEILGSALNVKSGIELIQTKPPDILFLDIELPDGTGFDILEKIEHSQFGIVFITAHNNYAQLAIDFAAMGYLDKPISSKKLSGAIVRAQDWLLFRSFQQQQEDLCEVASSYRNQQLPTRLIISNSSGIHYLPINDITYLTVDQGCIEVYLINGQRVSVSANLIEYERKFKSYFQFMRVHKSFLVNLLHVRNYKSEGVTVLHTGESIPISQRHLEEFKTRLAKI